MSVGLLGLEIGSILLVDSLMAFLMGDYCAVSKYRTLD